MNHSTPAAGTTTAAAAASTTAGGGTSAAPLRCARLLPETSCFDPHRHWYPRALNAQLHPTVASFLSLGNARMIERYCHLNPAVDKSILTRLIHSRCSSFRWSGADLFTVTNSRGKRQMIVVETNSCPSGQKSMPPSAEPDYDQDDGYHRIIRVIAPPLCVHCGSLCPC
jgi:hypothetical protein